jgi:hypothetical protein
MTSFEDVNFDVIIIHSIVYFESYNVLVISIKGIKKNRLKYFFYQYFFHSLKYLIYPKIYVRKKFSLGSNP